MADISCHQGKNIKCHLKTMANIFKRLNALNNPEQPLMQDNFYTTVIFTSLSQDWLPCISLLIMNKPYIASRRVIAKLKHRGSLLEGLRRGHQANHCILRQDQVLVCAHQSREAPKCWKLWKVDGHNLNTCFNMAIILWEDKAQWYQGAKGQQESTQSNKKKATQQPNKPEVKASRTSVAQLGQSTLDKNDNNN